MIEYIGGIGEKGLKSRFDQSTLHACMKFSNNKLKYMKRMKTVIPKLL